LEEYEEVESVVVEQFRWIQNRESFVVTPDFVIRLVVVVAQAVVE
jgi:hypothetical protein